MQCFRCENKSAHGAAAQFLRLNVRLRLRLCEPCLSGLAAWWAAPSVHFVDSSSVDESLQPVLFEIEDA